MISLKRNKRCFYLCKKIENKITFHNPEEKYLNYEPISSDGEMISIGPDYSKYLRINCTPSEATEFKNKDRCYMYKEPSYPFNVNCDDADYEVDGDPIITINEAKITLRKLSGE